MPLFLINPITKKMVQNIKKSKCNFCKKELSFLHLNMSVEQIPFRKYEICRKCAHKFFDFNIREKSEVEE